MDAQILSFILFGLQAVGAAFCTIIWFAYRDMKSKQESQQREMSNHKLQVAKDIDAAQRDSQRELSEYKLYAAEHYVSQNVLSKAVESIAKALEALTQSMDKKLDRIEYKLDGKQDKGQS